MKFFRQNQQRTQLSQFHDRTCYKTRIKSPEASPCPMFDQDRTIFNPDFRLPPLQPKLPHSNTPCFRLRFIRLIEPFSLVIGRRPPPALSEPIVMKTIELRDSFGIDSLGLGDHPIPPPAPAQLLLQVNAPS